MTAGIAERSPDWGYDPWPNEDTRPDHEIPAVAAASHTFQGADTIKSDIETLPLGLNMYASYVDNFGGYAELVQRFGDHFDGLLLSISVNPPGQPARCGDFEPGGLRNTDFPRWYDHDALSILIRGDLPWGYTNAANMADLIAAAGNRPFIRWSAHVGHGPHICGPSTCGFPQAHWTQWAFGGPHGENYDRSIGLFLPEHVVPHGTANAVVTLDETPEGGHWAIHGVSGHPLPPGGDEWDSAEVQFNRKSRVWRIHSLPKNTSPLGS